jgi:hypothetical protein
VSGTLPKGLKLSSGGALSGTPSVAETTTVQFRATDYLGATATKTFIIKIT